MIDNTQFKWPEEYYRGMRPGFFYDSTGKYAATTSILGAIERTQLESFFQYIHKGYCDRTASPSSGESMKYEGGYYYLSGEKLAADDPTEARLNNISRDGSFITYMGLNPQALICHKLALTYLQAQVLNDPQGFFGKAPEEILETILKTHEIACRYMPECQPGSLREKKGLLAFRMLGNEMHFYTSPEEVRPKMLELCKRIEELGQQVLSGQMDAISADAQVHQTMTSIHPVREGTGRLSRMWGDLFVVLGGKEPKSFSDYMQYQLAVENNEYEALLRELIED